MLARYFGLIALNLSAWQAAILFGKSFNGYYSFFIAILYSVVALARAPKPWKIAGFTLTFLALPLVDYLSHHQYIPITGLHSSKASFSLLVIDTVSMTGFIAILMFVEKFFADKHENDLKDVNSNLTHLVEKRTSLLLQSKEESIQTNIMKAQFLANISHELRIPVQGIIGFNELASKRLNKLRSVDSKDEKKQIESKLSKALESMEQSSKRLLDLLDRLLLLTRKGQNSFQPSPHSFFPYNLIKDTILKTQPLVKSTEIQFNGEEIKNINCMSDSVLIEQSLLNLLINAVQYSTPGSKISVLAKTVSHLIEIDITNMGQAISEAETEIIFEPFFQGSHTENRTGGTGLGLTLCRKYMEAIDGSISLAHNTQDKVTFRLSFPINFSAK